MTSNRKLADQNCTKICSNGFNYTVYTSPQPFFDFINVIIVNHYLSQWFPVQSPHPSVAILFCDIMKPEVNNITDIAHRLCKTAVCHLFESTLLGGTCMHSEAL